MATNWLLRIGDGEHFKSSSEQNIWGIKSPALGGGNPFIKDAEPGDLLWFVTGNSNGHIVALATYERIETRVLGPLIATTQTNDDLGWNRTEGEWDIEVHFNNLYNLTSLSLFSEIKGSVSIRRFNDNCKVDLPTEYKNILRYSKVTNCM